MQNQPLASTNSQFKRFLLLISTVLVSSVLFLSNWPLYVSAETQKSANNKQIFISEIFASGSVVTNGCQRVSSSLENLCNFDKWIEIYNPGEETVSLDGYRLRVQNGLSEILRGVSLAPKSFLVIDNGNYSRLGELLTVASETKSTNNQDLDSNQTESKSTSKEQEIENFWQNSVSSSNLGASDNLDLNNSSAVNQLSSESSQETEKKLVQDTLENTSAQDIWTQNTKLNQELSEKKSDSLKETRESPQMESTKLETNSASTASNIVNKTQSKKTKTQTLTTNSSVNSSTKTKTKINLWTSIEQAGVSRFSVGILHSLNPQNPQVELISPNGQRIIRSVRMEAPQTSMEFANSTDPGKASTEFYLEQNKGTPGYGLILEEESEKLRVVTQKQSLTKPEVNLTKTEAENLQRQDLSQTQKQQIAQEQGLVQSLESESAHSLVLTNKPLVQSNLQSSLVDAALIPETKQNVVLANSFAFETQTITLSDAQKAKLTDPKSLNWELEALAKQNLPITQVSNLFSENLSLKTKQAQTDTSNLVAQLATDFVFVSKTKFDEDLDSLDIAEKQIESALFEFSKTSLARYLIRQLQNASEYKITSVKVVQHNYTGHLDHLDTFLLLAKILSIHQNLRVYLCLLALGLVFLWTRQTDVKILPTHLDYYSWQLVTA